MPIGPQPSPSADTGADDHHGGGVDVDDDGCQILCCRRIVDLARKLLNMIA